MQSVQLKFKLFEALIEMATGLFFSHIVGKINRQFQRRFQRNKGLSQGKKTLVQFSLQSFQTTGQAQLTLGIEQKIEALDLGEG